MRHPGDEGPLKHDVEMAQRRDRDLGKLKALASLLVDGNPLADPRSGPFLKGQWRSFRDAHIEPDWLLIYTVRFELKAAA